jgi:hypothetical protein
MRGKSHSTGAAKAAIAKNRYAVAATLDALMSRFLVSGVSHHLHYTKKCALCLDLSAAKKI